MGQGHFTAHIRRMRLAYREQRDVLAAELGRRLRDSVTLAVPDQGMHLVAHLDRHTSDVELTAAARRRGILVRPISQWYKKASRKSGLMLGFTGFATEAIVPAAARLAELINERSGGRMP